MKLIKYSFEFIIIILLFLIFKIVGLKISRKISGFLFKNFGSFFRSKKTSHANLSIVFPNFNETQKDKILENMWVNYGKIFAEYMFIKKFRLSKKFSSQMIIENQDELEKIKSSNKPVIFISGHFNNFELMAMHLEKSGIELAAIYRPLNNLFLNPIMEKIRKKYICKKQIKKGISGTKELLLNFKKGTSIALMIDQRVSEGIRVDLFNEKALTTTIPAQFIKKFGAKIIPVHIERINVEKFNITFQDPIKFSKDSNIESITYKLNNILEEMIKKNPSQWIWSHNRWK